MPVKTRKRDPETNQRARQLRHGENMAEAVLWNELKAKKLAGYKFARQVPIGTLLRRLRMPKRETDRLSGW
jgi:very-short-patch-repair endonuclease